MNPKQNVSLADYSTMRIGGPAEYLVETRHKEELREAIEWAGSRRLPVLVIGDGANIVFRDEGFRGLVIVMRNRGIRIPDEDEGSALVWAAAGEQWDDVVAFSVDRDLSGIEALTAVPGTVGGAPVQNVGCYGQELSDTFVELEAYDTESKGFIKMDKQACGFRYRDSIFKSTHPGSQKGRYVIVSITLRLSKQPTLRRPLYESLQRFMDSKGIDDIGPKSIRRALLEWRGIYLPDPSVIPSNGSFFRNPVISKAQFQELKSQYPGLKGWPLDDSKPHHRDYDNHAEPMVKLAAAWLVDEATASVKFDSKLRLHDKQKIVVTNPDGATFAELEEFIQEITRLVKARFGVTLMPEPEFLP